MTRSSFLASAVLVALAFAGCGDNAEAPGPDDLVVSPTTITLRVGETTGVAAMFQKHGAEVAGGSVRWTSSDPTHAKVQGSGLEATITAAGMGQATITATGDELEATIEVSVSPALLAQIAITPAAPSLAAGTTATLHVIATFSDATTADVTDSVAWMSVAPAIAAVAGDQLSGLTKGVTTITAMYLGRFSSTAVFVTDALLRSIDVTPAAPAVVLGGTQQFTATGHFSDASVRDVTTTATWTSSATAIATISNAAGTRGLAATVGVGPTTIAATLGGVTGTATLTVEPSVLVSIAITPAGDLALGGDHPLTATGTFGDGSTMDLSATVAWASSNPAVATVAPGGLASALTLGSTTITATSGLVTGTATVNVVLLGVGAWTAVAGFSGQTCRDGVKLSMASDVVYVCTLAGGVAQGTVAADLSISFAAPNTGITGLQGLAIAAHTQSPTTMMYMSVPSGSANNWFRSIDSATTFAAFPLLDSAGNARFLYAGRFQPMIGNIVGSWDPGTSGAPQAIVLTGNNPPTGVHVVGTATGTVRSIAASAANNLYVGVLGETPAGDAATGGVFHSTSSGATWTETDTGIAAADKDRISSLVIDPANAMVLYAGVRGGARVYKTTDGGATWAASATGVPARARVAVLHVSPVTAGTVFAATDLGLYASSDGGATWALAGFQGRAVTSIAQSTASAALILAGVDDNIGLYRAQ